MHFLCIIHLRAIDFKKAREINACRRRIFDVEISKCIRYATIIDELCTHIALTFPQCIENATFYKMNMLHKSKMMKGSVNMTIDELRQALERIPDEGAINKARRRAIIILINKLLAGEPRE